MILYISTNDGSDMRITKEVKTLSEEHQIIFVGVQGEGECFVKPYCSAVHLVQGKRNHPLTMSKLFILVSRLLAKNDIKTIHVINEQLMVFFYPLLFLKPTILDLFDSIFLKKNYSKDKAAFLKRIVYAPVDKIIVTDHNRLELMPDFIKHKCAVLPNYPNRLHNFKSKSRTSELTILFNGWMGRARGTEIVEGLLKTGLPIRILMAGWFSDDYTREMVDQFGDKIDFKGVIPQQEALEWGAHEADYILCVYKPINQNNINASPNKIYDAIQTHTPLIINGEVKVSKFVQEKGIGMVIPSYDVPDYKALYRSLLEKRESYTWNGDLADRYSWEQVSPILKKLHSSSSS